MFALEPFLPLPLSFPIVSKPVLRGDGITWLGPPLWDKCGDCAQIGLRPAVKSLARLGNVSLARWHSSELTVSSLIVFVIKY